MEKKYVHLNYALISVKENDPINQFLQLIAEKDPKKIKKQIIEILNHVFVIKKDEFQKQQQQEWDLDQKQKNPKHKIQTFQNKNLTEKELDNMVNKNRQSTQILIF